MDQYSDNQWKLNEAPVTPDRWKRVFDSIGRTEDGDGDIFSTEKDDCYKQSHKKSA